MLVNSNAMLIKAAKEGYAIPQYNINNLEWVRFILEACQSDKSPVILGVTEGAVSYFGGYVTVYNVVKSLMQELNISIPVCLHLDHAKSFEACKKAIDTGFTSVMIDASSKQLEENIKETCNVVSYAKEKNISVEAEIGNIKEMDNNISYANVEDCLSFTSSTLVNSLAPAVGNRHGFYKEEDKIDFELLGSISKEVKLPLVLHGGSNLDDNKIRTAIFCGIAKININTDLQYAWASAVRIYLNSNKGVYDPRIIIKSGEQAIKSLIHKDNELFGSKGKAN